MAEREEDWASKARESRLRRKARRQGLRMVKSRSRDPRVFDYGRYRLVDPERNFLIAVHPLAFSLDEVETELAELAERGWTEERARER